MIYNWLLEPTTITVKLEHDLITLFISESEMRENKPYTVLSYSLTLKVVSQDPVERAVPSGETCKQDTLFSWPYNRHTRAHFRVSHTLTV